MTPQEKIEQALRSPNPEIALRSLIQELSSEGLQQHELYQLLESVVLQLRNRGASGEVEEVALNVMDALTGWCHPEARLFP